MCNFRSVYNWIALVFLIIILKAVYALPKPLKETSPPLSYFNAIFGHVHVQTDSYSESILTLSCGRLVKIINDKNHPDFSFVEVSGRKGHVLKRNLTTIRPVCFTKRYPKFFENLSIDPTEEFLWGRLRDQYVSGKSKVTSLGRGND